MCVDEVNKDNDGEDAAGSACEHLSDDEGEDDVAEIEGLTEETSEVGDHIEIDEHPVDETSSTKSDDVTNLQIAWEVIEVSKSIFSRHKDDQSQLNVAECLEKLGEISREKEDYEQAFADLKESLSIRLSILGNKDRGVAESYFQLGTTYAVSGNFDDANSYFRLSAECLKLHLIELEGRVTDKTVDNEQSSLLSSINEIKDLISDVQRRISDIEEDRLAEQLQPSDTQNKDPLAKNGSPACDISHLVRKKRVNCEKLQDSVVTQNGSESINGCNVSPISKKPKLSECSNVPVTNGVHE